MGNDDIRLRTNWDRWINPQSRWGLQNQEWTRGGVDMISQMRGLKTVRVDKDDLLDKVKENRADHRDRFEEAMAGYKLKAIELLERHIAQISMNAPEQVRVTLPMPEDHSDEYDRVIQMLMWSQDDELELSDLEFSEFVMDEWGWKTDFVTTAAMYSQA